MRCPYCAKEITGREDLLDVVFQIHLNRSCRRAPQGSKAAGPRRLVTVAEARAIRGRFKV
jgi:hypothetical protein